MPESRRRRVADALYDNGCRWLDEQDDDDAAVLDAVITAALGETTPVYQAYSPARSEGSNRLHLNRGHATNHARHTWYMSDVRRGHIVWDE